MELDDFRKSPLLHSSRGSYTSSALALPATPLWTYIEKHDTTENTLVPVSEKYTLTIKEAASYFNIGTKKMRRLAEDNRGRFAVFSGNRYLIIRPQFEKFISASSEI